MAVARVERQPISQAVEFIGRVEAIDKVEIRARVTAFLVSRHFTEGDQVKVIGAWAVVDGQDILLAVKVKKGEDVQLKVRRTKDGAPYWSMTPDQIKAETSAD